MCIYVYACMRMQVCLYTYRETGRKRTENEGKIKERQGVRYERQGVRYEMTVSKAG